MPNAFEVIAQVRRNMKRDGRSKEEIEGVTKKMQSSDYDHLIAVAAEHL